MPENVSENRSCEFVCVVCALPV